jgi:zinc/manganese transport system substrate-binding protein
MNLLRNAFNLPPKTLAAIDTAASIPHQPPGLPDPGRRLVLALPLTTLIAAPALALDVPLQVVTSFSLLADMVAQVGGPAVQVHALVGPDADAHAFTPAPADAQRLAKAELIVVNGLGFEGWIDRLVKASGSKAPVLVASQGVALRQTGRLTDPHAWQSLVAAQRYVENIRAALAAARPAQAAAINGRAKAYSAQLAALDRRMRALMASLPPVQRRIVTSHDAFGYLADNWGLQVQAAQGWTSAGEPSAADVARLIRQLKAQRARALFVENISDPRLIERIAREAGTSVGGTLYSDALSPPGTRADSYLKLMTHNAETLLAALAPELATPARAAASTAPNSQR